MKWKQVILVFLITLIFLEVGLQFIAFKFHRRAPDSFRSDDIRKIRILAIGESTTAKETAYRPNTDWPYLLEKRLKEKGYSVVVYNGGRGATTTSFLLSRLPHQIQKYNPHIVISMMGINDHNLFWLKEQSVFGGMGFWRNFRVIRLLAYLVSDKKSWVSSSMKLTRFGERDGRWFRSHLQMERVQEWITEISPQSKERVFNEIEGALKGISIEQQAQFYAFLAEKIDRTHQKLPFFNETVEELYVRSWDLSPKVHFVAEDLIDLIIRKGGAIRVDQCFQIAKIVMERFEKVSDVLLNRMALCARAEKNQQRWRSFFSQYGFEWGNEPSLGFASLTQISFLNMARILKQNGVYFVAMQYPMQPNGHIEAYFKDHPKSLWPDRIVHLEAPFQKTLSERSYEELFVDRFAGSFGHATEMGNEIIVRELVPMLESIFKNPDYKKKAHARRRSDIR